VLADAPPPPVEPGAPEPLLRGGIVRCQFEGCGHAAPEWQYLRMPRNPRHSHETVPVLRCPGCRRHFALLALRD
jgi:hypothetical protein